MADIHAHYHDNTGKSLFYALLILGAFVLIFLAILSKAYAIIGLFIFITGMIIMVYGAIKEKEVIAIKGLIVVVGGFLFVIFGYLLRQFLVNIGVVDFLKNLFNTS